MFDFRELYKHYTKLTIATNYLRMPVSPDMVTLYLSDLFTLRLSPLVIQCSCLFDMLTLFV